jgi:hypothetical protein
MANNYDECIIGRGKTNCQGVIVPDFFPASLQQISELTSEQRLIMSAKQATYSEHIRGLDNYNSVLMFLILLIGMTAGGFGVLLFTSSNFKLNSLCRRIKQTNETVPATNPVIVTSTLPGAVDEISP